MTTQDLPSGDVQRLKDGMKDPLHPLEEARIYARLLLKTAGNSQHELARRLGVSQARISQRLALLKMPREIVKLLEKPNRFTERHARCIRRLPDVKLQVWLAKLVAKDALSVLQTDEYVVDMLHEMGVTPVTRDAWFEAPGLRWRETPSGIEIKVRETDKAKQVKAVERLLGILQKGPAAKKKP